MGEERNEKSAGEDEFSIEKETVTDLDVPTPDAEEVKGGKACCGGDSPTH